MECRGFRLIAEQIQSEGREENLTFRRRTVGETTDR